MHLNKTYLRQIAIENSSEAQIFESYLDRSFDAGTRFNKVSLSNANLEILAALSKTSSLQSLRATTTDSNFIYMSDSDRHRADILDASINEDESDNSTDRLIQKIIGQ